MGISVIPAPSAGGKTAYRTTLTSGTSYTVPAGVTYLNVTLYGGGGGAGGNGTDGVSATDNTGGGGGGSRGPAGNANKYGGQGGSGVVIIRYPNFLSNATTTTGSPTFTNSGGYKVYTFTASGSIVWRDTIA